MMAKVRPAVVFSISKADRHRNMSVVVPMTTEVRGGECEISFPKPPWLKHECVCLASPGWTMRKLNGGFRVFRPTKWKRLTRQVWPRGTIHLTVKHSISDAVPPNPTKSGLKKLIKYSRPDFHIFTPSRSVLSVVPNRAQSWREGAEFIDDQICDIKFTKRTQIISDSNPFNQQLPSKLYQTDRENEPILPRLPPCT
jgi:hypothetical protein